MAELEGFESALREEMEERVESLGREAVERWVQHSNTLLRNAPVGIGAPRSAEEWNLDAIADSVEIRQEGDRWVAEWTATADDGTPLAPIWEHGSDPYIIEGDPVLRWTDEETGEVIFAARVEHPGIPAVAFIRIGKNRLESDIASGKFGFDR